MPKKDSFELKVDPNEHIRLWEERAGTLLQGQPEERLSALWYTLKIGTTLIDRWRTSRVKRERDGGIKWLMLTANTHVDLGQPLQALPILSDILTLLSPIETKTAFECLARIAEIHAGLGNEGETLKAVQRARLLSGVPKTKMQRIEKLIAQETPD